MHVYLSDKDTSGESLIVATVGLCFWLDVLYLHARNAVQISLYYEVTWLIILISLGSSFQLCTSDSFTFFIIKFRSYIEFMDIDNMNLFLLASVKSN